MIQARYCGFHNENLKITARNMNKGSSLFIQLKSKSSQWLKTINTINKKSDT